MLKKDNIMVYCKKHVSFLQNGDKESFCTFYFQHPKWTFGDVLEFLPREVSIQFNMVGKEEENGIYMSCSIHGPFVKRPKIAEDLVSLFEFKGSVENIRQRIWRGFVPDHYEIAGADLLLYNRIGFDRNAFFIVCPEEKLGQMITKAEDYFPELAASYRMSMERCGEFLLVQKNRILVSFPGVEDINYFLDYYILGA
jgi:hypothetical protein